MNKNILLVVLISLVVSLIQIRNPTFLFNVNNDDELFYMGENRIFSIYSWTNLNTVGISFPILLSILVSVYLRRNVVLALIFACGIIVAFLTKGRYIMISTIAVFSQLFLTSKSLSKRFYYLMFFVSSILIVAFAAQTLGYNLQDVIDKRILEKESDMASAKTRILSYEVFLVVYPENPWLGVGPETKKDVINLLGGDTPIIHIGYLSYLYFYGAIGCFLLYLALLFLLRDAWRVGRRVNFWGSYFGLIAFCLANFTMVYFDFSEMGIILSVIYVRYYNSLHDLEDINGAQVTGSLPPNVAF